MILRTANGQEYTCLSALIPQRGNAHLVLQATFAEAASAFSDAGNTVTLTVIGEQNEEQELTGYTHLDVVSNEGHGAVRVSLRPPEAWEEE